MAQIIDISSRITNELPLVRITDTLTITVNNRKNTIMNMQAMIMEETKKTAKNGGEYDELKLMNKTLEMLVGGKSAKEIEAMNLPLTEYKIVYQAIMAAATGSNMEDVEKRFQPE